MPQIAPCAFFNYQMQGVALIGGGSLGAIFRGAR